MRTIPLWVGTTDDAKVPLHVQLRIFEKQGGKCAITGHKFAAGDKKHLDHFIPLIDGGLHEEGNLRWVLISAHSEKTSAEAETRAKVRKLAASHAGLKRTPKAKEPRKPLKTAQGDPEIMRRFR